MLRSLSFWLPGCAHHLTTNCSHHFNAISPLYDAEDLDDLDDVNLVLLTPKRPIGSGSRETEGARYGQTVMGVGKHYDTTVHTFTGDGRGPECERRGPNIGAGRRGPMDELDAVSGGVTGGHPNQIQSRIQHQYNHNKGSLGPGLNLGGAGIGGGAAVHQWGANHAVKANQAPSGTHAGADCVAGSIQEPVGNHADANHGAEGRPEAVRRDWRANQDAVGINAISNSQSPAGIGKYSEAVSSAAGHNMPHLGLSSGEPQPPNLGS